MSNEKRVALVLKELGVPANVLGYEYLKTAILICLDNPDAIHATTKALYPAVAEVHNTTDHRVGMSIRHAIASGISVTPLDVVTKYMRVKSSGTVENSRFIASVAEAIRLEADDV